MIVRNLGRWPFQDDDAWERIFDFSGAVVVGNELIMPAGGGHAATGLASVARFNFITEEWTLDYDPVPYSYQQQYEQVPAEIPYETVFDPDGSNYFQYTGLKPLIGDLVATTSAGTFDETKISGEYGGIVQTWTLNFTSSTTFDIVGSTLGNVGSGSISTSTAPVNASRNKPYFSIDPAFFGGTWASGDSITFTTPAGAYYKSPWLDVNKFWQVPGYTPHPIARHTYDNVVYVPETGMVLLLMGNNGSYMGQPAGNIAKGGSRAAYDLINKQWTALANPAHTTTLATCRDPNTGYFWRVSPYSFDVYDGTTDSYVKRAGDPRNNSFWETPKGENPFKTDSALEWHDDGDGAVYISRQPERRLFYVRLDANNNPRFRELTQDGGEAGLHPSGAKWVWHPVLKCFLGGLHSGYMTRIYVDHVNHTWRWERTFCEGLWDQSSTWVNVLYNNKQYLVGTIRTGTTTSRAHTLFEVDWEVEGELPDTEAPDTINLVVTRDDEFDTGITATFESDDPTATFLYRLDGGSWAAAVSPLVLTGLAAGSHTLDVRAVDPAGNLDPTPASYSWVVSAVPDSTPPDTINLVIARADNYDPTATITFEANEPDCTFEASIDGGEWQPATSPLVLSGFSVGVHTVAVRAKDSAGNVDPTPAIDSWIMAGDVTPPDTTNLQLVRADDYDTSATATFGSDDPTATFEARLNGGEWAAAVSPLSFSGLSVGVYTLEIRAVDPAGNIDPTPASVSWEVKEAEAPPPSQPGNLLREVVNAIQNAYDAALAALLVLGVKVEALRNLVGDEEEPPVDTVPPQTMILSVVRADDYDTNAVFTFSADEVGCTFEVSVDGGPWQAATSPHTLVGLSVGSHTFAVRATDPAGNTDPTPAESTWDVLAQPVDEQAPDTTIVQLVRADVYDTNATIVFSASEPDCTFEASVNGGEWEEVESPLELSGLVVGGYTVAVRAIDPAGNVDETPAEVSWEVVEYVPQTPVITSALPLWDGESGVTINRFNTGAFLNWRQRGGDWLDKDGVAYGTNYFARWVVRDSDRTPTIDVTELALKPNTGIMMRVTGGWARLIGRDQVGAPTRKLTYDDDSEIIQNVAAMTYMSYSSSGSYTKPATMVLDTGRVGLMQFPDVPNIENLVKAELMMTASDNSSSCGINFYQIWQPKIFDFEAHAPTYGIAKANGGYEGLVQHSAVDFADLHKPIAELPVIEQSWMDTMWHRAGRDLTIAVGEGPFGTNALKAVQPLGGEGNKWDAEQESMYVGRTHEYTRQFVSTDVSGRGGTVMVRHNPYNGRLTTLDMDAEQTSGRYLADPTHAASPTHRFMHYSLWFDEDFIECPFEGSKLPGLSGQYGGWNSVGYYTGGDGNGGAPTKGIRTSSGFLSGWSARSKIEAQPRDDNPLRHKRALSTYLYHVGMTDYWGTNLIWGNHDLGWVLVEANRWYFIDIEVKMNTVIGPFDELGNGTAVPDGILRVWINGVLVLNRTDITYRRHDYIKIDAIWMDYVHGGSGDPEWDHHFLEGPVVAADQYVGPPDDPRLLIPGYSGG